jgi:hypothetical protein
MIKKLETQDQYGNKIYRYTSSDVVLDLDTGHTVKQDIDLLMGALGLSSTDTSGSTQVNINATTLGGYEPTDFVQSSSFTNSITTINNELAQRATYDSPAFTGTPTVPSVDIGDNSEKIANTKYVDDTAAAVKQYVQDTLTANDYAASKHTHSASDIISGEFAVTNVRAKDGTDYTAARLRNIAFVGENEGIPSTLSNGSLLFSYEG